LFQERLGINRLHLIMTVVFVGFDALVPFYTMFEIKQQVITIH
jgi:hypothetical protein